MAIVFAVILIWLAIHIFLYSSKQENPLEAIFVFMMISIGNNIFCSIITENLGWAKAMETPTAITVIILQRIIIIPLFFLIIVNGHNRLKKVTSKLLLLLFSCVLIVAIEELCSYFHIMNYIENRWLIPVLHSCLLYLTGVLALHLYRPILKKGVMMR